MPLSATDGHLVCSVSYASTVSLGLQRFGDQLALYDLGVPSWDELVAAAADALADGCDGPAVVALASQPATGPRDEFDLKDTVSAAREELGMPVLDEVATAVRATQGQIRRWQRGQLLVYQSVQEVSGQRLSRSVKIVLEGSNRLKGQLSLS